MNKLLGAAILVVSSMGLAAQESKPVTVTGCLKAGDGQDAFVPTLPGSDAKAQIEEAANTLPDSSAYATRTVTYVLLTTPETDLKPHVGHTVEVTGYAVPRQMYDTTGVFHWDPFNWQMQASQLKMIAPACKPQP